MNILIYFPYNLRTVEQQSVMEMLVTKGHTVVLLTTCERGYLHEFVEEKGIIGEWINRQEVQGKFSFYKANFKKLKHVLEEYKIDVVFAHQQSAALLAGLMRKTKKFQLIYVRHNSDEDYQLHPAKAKWYNRLINYLTPIKVAPSSVVKRFWIEEEGVASRQITHINYGYNFNQYPQPVYERVKQIKKEFPGSLRILSVARLVSSKRHELMFAVIKRLVDSGVNCRMICLGSGPLQTQLQQKISSAGLENHIFLLGRQENVFDYLAASDVFMHLSSTEASNSAVKEAGLCKKLVLACKGVGDFEDYIVNYQNGFLLNKAEPVEEAFQILMSVVKNEIHKESIGEELFTTVITKFDINNVAHKYDELLNRLEKS